MIKTILHQAPDHISPAWWWEVRGGETNDLLGWVALRLPGYQFFPHSPSELTAGDLVDIGNFLKSQTDEYFAKQGRHLS